MYWTKCGSESIRTSSPLEFGGWNVSGNPPANSPIFLQCVPNRYPSHDVRTMSAALKGLFGTTLRGAGIKAFWISDVYSPVHAGMGLHKLFLAVSARGIKVVHFVSVDWRM